MLPSGPPPVADAGIAPGLCLSCLRGRHTYEETMALAHALFVRAAHEFLPVLSIWFRQANTGPCGIVNYQRGRLAGLLRTAIGTAIFWIGQGHPPLAGAFRL
jgi:hypothetical protein